MSASYIYNINARSISKMQKIFGLGTDYDNNYDISLIADLLQMNIIN